MFCHRHPKRIAVKSCFYCGRHICPRCQWRSSYHTFCSHACYSRYVFWQRITLFRNKFFTRITQLIGKTSDIIKEARRVVIPEIRVLQLQLYKKAGNIPAGNNLIPLILPIIALSSIHTYVKVSGTELRPPGLYAYHSVSIVNDEEISGQNTQIVETNNSAVYDSPAKIKPASHLAVNTVQPLKALRPFNTLKPKEIISDITRGSLMKKELSLTFDGGSDATDAENILNILRERNIKTTIFLTGGFIKRYPELVRKMAEDGHEIGNHSLTHPHLTTFEKNFKQQTLPGINKEFIAGELKETARIFRELTGKGMIPYWRAPYGEQNAEIRQWAYEAGFTHVGWTTGYKKRESLDTLDWVSNEESEFYYSADEIKERVLNFDKEGNGVSGGIVLMHLGTERKESHAYTKLPEIIDTLTDRGYRIVKVTELLKSSR